jgi:hypothetical protein
VRLFARCKMALGFTLNRRRERFVQNGSFCAQ